MYIPNILAQLNEATHQHLEEISVKFDVAEWKDAPTARAIAGRIREHLLDDPGRFPSLRRMAWLVSGSACLRAGLVAGLASAGCEKKNTKGVSPAGVQVEVTTCDGGVCFFLDLNRTSLYPFTVSYLLLLDALLDFGGYLDDEEDIFEIV
ncbi:hypothetical protein CVT25_009969 [Psilocybe cyanescens]|uniref:Uncharacterized protein n=1 Tax=Psilocybe cyanescens TaxID=93625 RepID=A0A409XCR2_PSICY|nr:hypothetical protein CVT25_009969 [Psilocybe cyanescens]